MQRRKKKESMGTQWYIKCLKAITAPENTHVVPV